jgi:hypothetical protein
MPSGHDSLVTSEEPLVTLDRRQGVERISH